MFRLISVFTSVWLVASTLHLPAATREEFEVAKIKAMEDAVLEAIRDGECPGAVVWLERNGLVYEQALGKRALVPAAETMTPDTIFDLASLTKAVATAPCIMRLLEQGKLALEDSVTNYIPAFAGGGKDEITVRQLLLHISGLRPGIELNSWTGREGAIAKACREKTAKPPGTEFRYSDINFILLGEIVRRVSGQPLEVFAAQEIFQRLKMTDTGFLPSADKLDRIAPTEVLTNQVLRGVVHDPTARKMGGVAGHAGLFSTTADLARFARMLLNEGELDGVRVLRPQTVRLMTGVQTPPSFPVRRGLGWDIDSPYSGPRGAVFPLGSYGHSGWTGTSIWIDPFSKTFLILLSNRNHPTEKGNVIALRHQLATLAAQAVKGFDFSAVPGALAPIARDEIANKPPPIRKSTPSVLNGIDVLVRDRFAPLRNLRVGLITNQTGQDRERRATIDLLSRAEGVQLKALFCPEHGIRGSADERLGDSVDAATGLTIHSLYGVTLKPTSEQLAGLDALVFDIQDIGCRFYTYTATMAMAMEAAAASGLKFFVLDRVNPIGGAVEGPVLAEPPTFVGYHSVPLRHGMTAGELALLFRSEKLPHLDLTVVPLEQWRHDMFMDAAGLPWTNPSPNMRTLEAAILYPGLGLLESAVSVGRGTDTPFQIIGAPYVDDLLLAQEMNGAQLPGLRFLPVRFTPSASIHAGQACGGVRVLLTDRGACRSVDLGIVLAKTLWRLYPENFDPGKMAHLLLDQETLQAIRQDRPLPEIKKLWDSSSASFRQRRAACLLYP